MCTVVILRRPGHAWPLIVAANRDEMASRPSLPPAAHWPGHPGVWAGRDALAGGTWLGLNRAGVLAAVMNRVGSLGPAPGKASRGALPLAALAHGDAASGAAAISALDGAAYRPFNLLVADCGQAFWLRLAEGSDAVERQPVPEGVAMLTAHDLNDTASARIRRHLPRFRAAAPPAPPNDWDAWVGLIASTDHDPADGPQGAMTIPLTGGFGTVSSSLIALGADGARHWRYADGPPTGVPYRDISVALRH
ncbi:MAG: NRDE family protein [Alphaproteobacteria bacterium]|nr:NRDE family protein [Alphaproteobacteria bacterium]